MEDSVARTMRVHAFINVLTGELTGFPEAILQKDELAASEFHFPVMFTFKDDVPGQNPRFVSFEHADAQLGEVATEALAAVKLLLEQSANGTT